MKTEQIRKRPNAPMRKHTPPPYSREPPLEIGGMSRAAARVRPGPKGGVTVQSSNGSIKNEGSPKDRPPSAIYI